jgi:NADH-ubiquinone oxidoreductase chain 1
LTGNLNLTLNVEAQKVVFFVIPLLPILIIFFIGCIAETNRAPFDLAEAESELVSGFMTEHSAVIFVFFFLAEYASIVLICIFTSILFLGGYLKIFSFDNLTEILLYIYLISVNEYFNYSSLILINSLDGFFNGLIASLSLGIKSCLMIFIFILARASYPRIRFDQLMSYC